MTAKTTPFTKAATTEVPVARTQGELIALLARYGGSGFGFRWRSADVVAVTFHVPRSGDPLDRSGDELSVEVPINVAEVLERLEAGRPRGSRARRPDRAQAERVAWRILYLLVDAALAAVSVGVQTVEEAFFAHVLLLDTDGQAGRAIDYVQTLQAATGGRALPGARILQRLLPSSSDR